MIIPGRTVFVVNNHGMIVVVTGHGVMGPLINGLFMDGGDPNYLLSGMILQSQQTCPNCHMSHESHVYVLFDPAQMGQVKYAKIYKTSKVFQLTFFFRANIRNFPKSPTELLMKP